MPVERRGDLDIEPFMDGTDLIDEPGQVPLKVSSRREEIWNHDYALGSLRHQPRGRFRQAGRREVEKRRLDKLVAALARHVGRHCSNRFVGFLDARAVREDNDPCFHACPPMQARIWLPRISAIASPRRAESSIVVRLVDMTGLSR